MKTNKLNPMWTYTIAAYLAFWAIILVLGGLASMVFDAPPAVMTGITILGSWSPTIVLLLMLRKLKPGLTIKGFYKQAFHDRLKPSLVLAVPIIVFGILLAAAWAASLVQGTALADQVAVPSALGLVVLLTVFQGPSGEESGWRGYLRPELEGRYGFTRGNVILGLVWAFWHAPLWLVASDYAGAEALVYVVANIVVLTALTLIMGVFMRRCDNLFLAFWIHFCFNVSLRLFTGDIRFFVFLSVLYAVVALGLLPSMRRTSQSPVMVSARSRA
jgi:CAAX amino terminal protease family.